MTELHCDFETFSEAQLVGPRSVGLMNYMQHPMTEPLMLAWSWNDSGIVEQADFTDGDRIPLEVIEALGDPNVLKWGYNSAFERLATTHLLGLDTPIRGWRCDMVLSYMRSFQGGLGDVGAQLGLPAEQVKDPRGKKLIQMFSVPQKVTRNQPHLRRDSSTDPEAWQEFLEYNKTDVFVEKIIHDKLIGFPVLPQEWELYEIDQEINDAGLPVDMAFVRHASEMAQRRKDELVDIMRELTSLHNPNSTQQLLPWLKERGYPFSDLQKNTIKKVLAENEQGENPHFLDGSAVASLKLRQQASRTSVKKYDAIDRRVNDAGRICHCFQFAGASRTNRWSGRGPQPQNLVRTPKLLEADDGDFSKLESATDAIRYGDYDLLELLVDEPMVALAGCLRSSFRAPEGYEFVVCDLSAIESAVIAWLSGCKRMLGVFRDKKDPYRDFGTELYGKPYDEITKAERNICKPPTLGCFAPDTLVLTTSGWKRIVEVNSSDKVHDGVEFVRHGGVIDQGARNVMVFNGVVVTSNHEFLAGNEWRTAWDLSQDSRIENRAIDLAIGLLSRCAEAGAASDTIGAFVVRAGVESGSTATRWRLENLSRVFRVLTRNSGLRWDRFMKYLTRRVASWTLSLIGIMQSFQGAAVSGNRPIAMEVEGSNVGSKAFTTLSGMFCRSLSAASRLRSIVSTMTGTTSEVISDLSRQQKIKPTAAIRVYDIANCGPRNRFVILTDKGPMIAHNCGFGLGGGKLHNGKRTGLWGYAESMGVDITRQESERQVKLFRKVYSEIPAFWRDLDQAVARALKGKTVTVNGLLRFKRDGNFITMELPSGRTMFYHRPKIMVKEFPAKDGGTYEKAVFTHMGKSQITNKWQRIVSGGPKLCLGADTRVLTDRGWIPIVEVNSADRVWDGGEWVEHGGVVFNGYAGMITVDGVHMTPDHLVLTERGWNEAKNCDGRNRYETALPDGVAAHTWVQKRKDVLGSSVRLRRDTAHEGGEVSARRGPFVWMPEGGFDCAAQDSSWDVQTSGFSCVAVDARAMHVADTSVMEELRRQRDHGLQAVDDVRELLGRYGRRISEWVRLRPRGQRPGVFAVELPMGHSTSEQQQQEDEYPNSNTLGRNDGCGSVQTFRYWADNATLSARENERPVFDILNAGHNNRFVVAGEVGPFLVHNCENAVQAAARDVLAVGMRRAVDYGFTLVGSVHDEIICLQRKGDNRFTLEALREMMIEPLPWMAGLPLGAAGYVGELYRKD